MSVEDDFAFGCSRCAPHGTPTRVVITPAGERWCVFEYLQRYGSTSRLVLVIEGRTFLRIVKRFPRNWRELSDAELLVIADGC